MYETLDGCDMMLVFDDPWYHKKLTDCKIFPDANLHVRTQPIRVLLFSPLGPAHIKSAQMPFSLSNNISKAWFHQEKYLLYVLYHRVHALYLITASLQLSEQVERA